MCVGCACMCRAFGEVWAQCVACMYSMCACGWGVDVVCKGTGYVCMWVYAHVCMWGGVGMCVYVYTVSGGMCGVYV